MNIITKYVCFCGIVFKQEQDLYVHMRNKHSIKPWVPHQRNPKYECANCGKKFSWQSGLVKHIRDIHSNDRNKLIGINNKIGLVCPHGSCDISCRRYANLRKHLAEKHEFTVELEELSFSSIDDFEKWKDNVELATVSQYSKSTSTRTLKVEKAKRIFFNCHRSSTFTYKGKNIRANAVGSKKIGRACPSRLEVTYTEYLGQTIIRVKYWKTHCGHTVQIDKRPLKRKLKCLLAEKLEKGYTFEQVFDWARNSELEESVSKRLQHINRKDLYNIIRDFNIKRPAQRQTTKKKVKV